MKFILYVTIAVACLYTFPYVIQLWGKEKNKLGAVGIVVLLAVAAAGAVMVRIR